MAGDCGSRGNNRTADMAVFAAERASGIAHNGKTLEHWFSQTLYTTVLTNGASTFLVNVQLDEKTYLENEDNMKRAFWATGTNFPDARECLVGANLHPSKSKSTRKSGHCAKARFRGRAPAIFRHASSSRGDL
jgi:hypothetical protein